MLTKSLRSSLLFTAIAYLSASSLISSAALQAQTTLHSERSQGVSLYEKGDNAAAIKLFKDAIKRDKADLISWQYLGLASERDGKTIDALNAYEKSATLGDGLLEARFLKTNTKKPELFLEAIHEPLSFAAISAEKYIALNVKLSGSNREEWTRRLESLLYFAEASDAKNSASGQNQLFSDKEVSTKAHILSKTEPMYTNEALQNLVTGTIVLRAVFGADGRLWAIRPLRQLPFGLTDSAIKAAHQIRFVPATKDGRPVSTFQEVEYSFNLFPR